MKTNVKQKITTYICHLISILFFCLVSFSCNNTPPQKTIALGTVCSINLFEGGNTDLYNKIFQRLQEIDFSFSTTNLNSQISLINAASGKNQVSISKEVADLLEKSLYFAKLSNGDFNPVIGPVVNAWQITKQQQSPEPQIPEISELEKLRPLLDYTLLEIKKQNKNYSAYLAKEGMALDLGAIAKGYAADEVLKIIKLAGIKRAIVDLGGNICIFGKKKDDSLWKVGIKDPFAPDDSPVLALDTHSTCVVTSGVYERFFYKDGIRYHHIIDPKTLQSAKSNLMSATIIAPCSTNCDALSTIAFIKGQNAIDFLSSLPPDLQCSAVLIKEDKTILASKALEPFLTLLKQDYKKIEFF